MIISASRRTDIPAFYTSWFMHRLQSGEVCVRNPMNHKQISRIFLSPESVDCIVFWTKDPYPLLSSLPGIDQLGYSYYFQFTLTPYGKDIEKKIRNKKDIADTFQQLGHLIGRERLLWRYDPIILNDEWDIARHIESFTQMCRQLHAFTSRITISFVDNYAKLKTNRIRHISAEEMVYIGGSFADIARRFGLTISACCEKTDLTSCGISKACCIDRELIKRICGCKIHIPRDKNQRDGCGCASSVDIGVYNTCQNGCVYCYANYSETSVQRNCRRHDSQGEFLIGTAEDTDVITRRNPKTVSEDL